MDWLDLLAVQRTLKSLLQYHSSKASVLQCSGFFIVQLSHPYMTTGKTIALTRWTFVGKVMPLLFNMLSSVQFSCSVMSDSANPWTSAHQASLSITNSQSLPKFMSIELVMLSNHLILCFPFSSCPQSFPVSVSFQMIQLFASGGQSIGVSASTSVLPMNAEDWSLLGWTGWISKFRWFWCKEYSP